MLVNYFIVSEPFLLQFKMQVKKKGAELCRQRENLDSVREYSKGLINSEQIIQI